MSENPFAAPATAEPSFAGSMDDRETRSLRYVHPLRAGTVLGVLSAAMTAIFMLLYAPFLLVIFSSMPTDGPGAPPTGAFMGGMVVAMVVIGPVLYGVFGFVGGVVAAWIYNLIAKWTGGLKLDFV